jgi:hypothetical protein
MHLLVTTDHLDERQSPLTPSGQRSPLSARGIDVIDRIDDDIVAAH